MINFSRIDLLNVANILNLVAPKNENSPTLEHAFFAALNGRGTIAATNLDMSVICNVAAVGDGTALLPVRKLQSLAKSAPQSGDNVKLVPGDGLTAVDFGRARYDLPALPVADFPALVELVGDTETEFTVAGQDLHNLFDRISGAISTEETRYYLNGIFMHSNAGALHLVATDGHRLYHSPMANTGFSGMAFANNGNETGIIIPLMTVKLLLKMLAGKNKPDLVTITIPTRGNAIRFSWQTPDMGLTVTSKTIDGTFPDWRRVVPATKNFTGNFAVRSDTLAETIKAAGLLKPEKQAAVHLSIADTGRGLATAASENGTSSIEFPTVSATFSGFNQKHPENIGIALSDVYMLAAIEAVSADISAIDFTDAGTAIVISGHNTADQFQAVVMPRRR